ncbi:hypothetical protein SUNI508_06417 [Seiridium unicorne]|uniref:Uncharacterized protein n=1 Tax=Seiridium unicorne TaxID=138068 RepID=A0ABR2V0Q9_9PEZI
MTDPQQVIDHQHPPAPAVEEVAPDSGLRTPPFQPIYTLVNNTSTKTTHHPQVRYIFSDDDPDVLTQALAQQHDTNLGESASGPAPDNRAILLDLSPDAEGAYSVSWASSLSPSWAVLDAQVSRISPPSSDGGGSGDNGASQNKKKPDRLMLRIEGIEGGSLVSSAELRLSGEKSGQGLGSGSGSGSGQKGAEGEDYNSMVDEFDKRMTMLRKVVDAGEERRTQGPEGIEIGAQEQGAPTSTEDLRRSVDSG